VSGVPVLYNAVNWTYLVAFLLVAASWGVSLGL
jgi:hypothetical protein